MTIKTTIKCNVLYASKDMVAYPPPVETIKYHHRLLHHLTQLRGQPQVYSNPKKASTCDNQKLLQHLYANTVR